ncbi:NHS-like protein 3 isoform X2 [Myripristis murdjan]|uniref:NHS-like protein 3 isoform X2 n=1 Tax=Myripristis murdjan TaxID=586833 RepID=UPI001175E31A|nr:uncharacterized protein KIAA1522 homolog isoform X2 [Myripristis murdjan]
MGNSIHKKKVQAERSVSSTSSPSPSRVKPKGFWLFGHSDKLKTAGPKGSEEQKRLAVHYTASQHYQENVFIEGSRPQYLEDLHTEAQEGLKIQQQEENKNGVNFQDDESIASTDTLRPEQDISSKDDGGFPESRSTSGNTDTTATSPMSAGSTRPVLTRQGSTFKPLNPVKRLDKGKKRSRRTTIMGIPHQVQRELALHRNSTFQQVVSTQLPNGDGRVSDGQSSVVIIPTIVGESLAANQEGARVHLSDLEQGSREEQLLRHHLQAMYQDEQPFKHQGFDARLSSTSSQRPKSVAVPGMTTSSSSPSTMFSFLQEPQGPVMSISPQATYLSKIIPNAVLPASIEVIQIDRSSSRTHGKSSNHGGSVRTVSKSSLASGDSSVSPASSRRSEGDGSHIDNSHNSSTPMPASASGSNWSQSQSSETVMSNSSTIFSKGTTYSGNTQTVGLPGQESQPKQPGGDQDHLSSVSSVSSPSSKVECLVKGPGPESGVSGSLTAGEYMRNSRPFSRNLSVMKTKLPPAPPRRTNSLHNNKIKSNSRNLVDSKNLNDSVLGEVETATENILSTDVTKLATADVTETPKSASNSAGSSSLNDSRSSASSSPLSPSQASSNGTGGTPEPRSESSSSSPQKTPSEGGKFERTMSPSSGYSSQSGTPTLSPKGISPTSPEKQKKKPVKPERSVSRASSSAASASSSLTSLSSTTSEPVNQDVSTSSSCPSQQGSLPSVAATEKITPVNNCPTATLAIRDFFNIPPPPKVKAPCPPPPETWAHNRRTFELLCGPCPNVDKQTQLQKPGQLKDGTVKIIETPSEASKDSAEKQVPIEKPVLELSESKETVLQDKPEALLETVVESVSQELESRECPSTEQERQSVPEKVEASMGVQIQDKNKSSSLVKDVQSPETMPKKEPPPVMPKTIPVSPREESVSNKLLETQPQEVCADVKIEVHVSVENDASSSQTGAEVLADKSEVETDRGEVTPMQTLYVDVPKINKVSPPATPPPPYHPTPPPSRKTPPSSVSMPPDELKEVQEEIHVLESCWPPPPPPLEGDAVFDGGDEMDFPPPPPPFMTDSLPDMLDSCIAEIDAPNRPIALEEVGVTINDSVEAGKSMNEETADLPPVVPQTVVNEAKPEDDVQFPKADTDKDICYRAVSSLPKGVPPPPVEAPPPPPTTTTEKPLSVFALVPPSSVPKPDTLKIEDQTPPEPPVSVPLPIQISVPVAPPLPVENQGPGVNFRRQPSLSSRDTRSKELLSRHKSAPIPKEDANIPLVTPSLLQMVRLRSVSMAEDQVKATSEDNKSTNGGAAVQDNCPVSIAGPQNIPQKPIRKSLSLKSQTVKTSTVTLNAPSMRLQEAIRMKTAAMSSRDGLPARLGLRSSTSSSTSDPGAPSPKSPDIGDMHKSPASTASFIFSRSTKKVVIETPVATPEAQASLKQSLAAELMQVSDHSKAIAFSNGGMRSDKVPPPVAKKPAHGSSNPSLKLPAFSAKMELSTETNGVMATVQPVGQKTPPTETTTTVTADTIETLF